MEIEAAFTAPLGRAVKLRKQGSDRQTWMDTFVSLYHVPPLSRAPATVLDLGANIGLTCAHYKVLWPEARIVGFEMDLNSCQMAQENAPGCEFVCAAVSTYTGTGRYARRGRQESYRLGDGETETTVVALDEIVNRWFGGFVDFVKMDVEGEEWRLFGALDSWAPLVGSLLVELHPTDAHPLPAGMGGWPRERLLEQGVEMLTRHFSVVAWHAPHPLALYAETAL